MRLGGSDWAQIMYKMHSSSINYSLTPHSVWRPSWTNFWQNFIPTKREIKKKCNRAFFLYNFPFYWLKNSAKSMIMAAFIDSPCGLRHTASEDRHEQTSGRMFIPTKREIKKKCNCAFLLYNFPFCWLKKSAKSVFMMAFIDSPCGRPPTMQSCQP